MFQGELRDLPAVVDVETAGRVLGLGRGAAYELVRTGQWPTPVLRLGRLIKVPTAPLQELLGQLSDRRAVAGSAESVLSAAAGSGAAQE